MSELTNTDTGYADEATPVDGLRAWAQGMYPSEAATEMLIRAGYAQTWRPWSFACEPWGEPGAGPDWHGIDFTAIPEHIHGMSGGERRFLLAAASVGSGQVDVSIGEVVSGIDRYLVDLILAGIAHASGTHEGRPMIVDHEAGTASFGDPYNSLHPWPSTPEKR